MRLFDASSMLVNAHSAVALGLAQIGQEEIGKSLSLLAAIGLKPVPDAWNWFWQGWRDHGMKAHRAYLYELLDPLRIEIQAPDGRILDGGPLRDRIAMEKEAAFYVDFDGMTKEFIAPEDAVKHFEAYSRIATLGYLARTASIVHDTLIAKDLEYRTTAFSEIAFRICTENIYQQDMTAILEEFAKRSPKRHELIEDLRRGFAENPLFRKGRKGNHLIQNPTGSEPTDGATEG
jgi:AbiV family abortive infection protein